MAAQATAAQWASAYTSHLQLVYETADIQECPCGRRDNLSLCQQAYRAEVARGKRTARVLMRRLST